MSGLVFKLVFLLTECPYGIFELTLKFFFTMPDFWDSLQYKMAHMFYSDSKEHFGKALMGKSSFDKATKKKIMEICQTEILGFKYMALSCWE